MSLQWTRKQFYRLTCAVSLHGNSFHTEIIQPPLQRINFFRSNLSGAFEPEKKANKAGNKVDVVAAFGVYLDEEMARKEGLLIHFQRSLHRFLMRWVGQYTS